MKTFYEFVNEKNVELYNEFFNSKKNLYVNNEFFIIDEENNKILENSIFDYLNKNNPIEQLSEDLSDKNYSYSNFSIDELQKIVILFLRKNSPKEIKYFISTKSEKNSIKNQLKIYDPYIYLIANSSFQRNLIDHLDDYKNIKGKIKEIFDFLISFAVYKLKGEDFIKFILYLNDNELEYVFEKLYDDNAGRQITIDNLFQLINSKKNAPTSYFERLINAFVTNRNTDDKEIKILQKFVEDYNKNNPNDPIKPINFEDLRMKNFSKKLPSAKDSLKSFGVSFLATMANKLKLN